MNRAVWVCLAGLLASTAIVSTAHADAMEDVPTGSQMVLHLDPLASAGPLGAAIMRTMGVPVTATDPVAAMAEGLGVSPALLDGFRDAALAVPADPADAVLLVPSTDYDKLAAAVGGQWSIAHWGQYAALARRPAALTVPHGGLPISAATANEVALATSAPGTAALWVNLPDAHGVVALVSLAAPPATRPAATRPATQPAGFLVTSADRAFAAVGPFLVRLGRDPGPAAVHGDVGQLMLRTGHPSDAGEQFREAAALDPSDSVPHVNLASALVRQSEPFAALRELRKAIEIDPHNAAAVHNEGIILAQLGQFEPALRPLIDATRLQPRSAEYRNDLAVVLSRTGRYQLAELELIAALRLQPNYADAQRNLAIVRRLAAQAATRPATAPATAPATP